MSTQVQQSSRFCLSCGRRLQNFSARAANGVCVCGERYELAGNAETGRLVTIHVKQLRPSCQHRGPSAGKASCGCGAVYRCNLLHKYCADQPLAFPLYEINIVNEDGSTGQLLSKEYQSDSRAVSESFQACSECDDNSNKPTEKPAIQKPCSSCGQPSTRMCWETSSFGVCGEPLCEACKCRLHGWG